VSIVTSRPALLRLLAVAALVAMLGCRATRPTTRPGEDHEQRAGFPSQVSPHARPSDDGNYSGYEVGGGAVRNGDGPGRDDGTWGWDYACCWLRPHVVLGWWHGRKHQGSGSYDTDGPRPIEKIERRHEK
jgi:hypothetical protein